MTGLSSYWSQSSIYTMESEQDLNEIVKYLAGMMAADGDEFVAYQEIMLTYGDQIDIPFNFDGDYHPAKIKFYQAFNKAYPGQSMGIDVKYLDMPEDLQILYGTYKHEYWLHVFEEVKYNFGAMYTYYIVPTGEPFHMYYVVDCIPEKRTKNGQELLQLNLDIDEPYEKYPHMWDTWEAGKEIDGHDIFNNQYGHTYGNYYPLWVNGKQMGLVCADIEVEKVNATAINNSVNLVIIMAILSAAFAAFLSYILQKRYVSRLVQLKKDVQAFTAHKDTSLAVIITNDVKGTDEISDLAQQVSTMIIEIGDYMNTLIEKNQQLLEAHERIRQANDLANRDALTGIRNKNAYDTEVDKIEYRMEHDKFKEFGIAMIDLNYLKYINDNFGHEKGNMAIKKVCDLVCHHFSHSPVFRIGGDEFVVILENDDYKECQQKIQEFQDIMEEIANDTTLEPWERVSAAVGWTLFDPDTDNCVQNVFKRADDFMYKNKKAMKAERN